MAQSSQKAESVNVRKYDNVVDAYKAKVEANELRFDEHQAFIIQQLENLNKTLKGYQPPSASWLGKVGMEHERSSVISHLDTNCFK